MKISKCTQYGYMYRMDGTMQIEYRYPLWIWFCPARVPTQKKTMMKLSTVMLNVSATDA